MVSGTLCNWIKSQIREILGEYWEQQKNEICNLLTQTQKREETEVLLLLYIQTSICVCLFQRQVMVKDGPSVSLWPLLMLTVSQQELASHFQTQILPENRHWLCSQRNSVKWATTRAWLTGWVCTPKAEITNPYNHVMLKPVSNSRQHVWDVARCTFPSPALPMYYMKQLKPQLSCTPVKYPVSRARHPAQTEEYKVLLTPALRVDLLFPI